MSTIASRSRLALADALRAQAKALEATAAVLEAGDLEPPSSKYLDQHTSPLSKRVYLDHARRRSFPTKTVGKRILVEAAVFERWLGEHARRPKPAPAPPVSGPRSVDEDVLAELGARSAGAKR